jgi:hypothetical protein
MKQIYTGKIESASFSNPPENSTIEFLWRDEDQLVANQIIVNFSDPEFLAFIKEYPLEKIEKAARAAAAKKAKIKQDYDQKIIDEYKKKNDIDLFNYIDKNDNDKDIIFDCKLKILDAMKSIDSYTLQKKLGWTIDKDKDISFEQSLKIDKQFTLRVRKIKTLKELLGLYYGI